MIGLAAAIVIAIHIADVFAPPKPPPLAVWTGGAAATMRPLMVAAGDGTTLRGWLAPATRAGAPYVLFFYGSNEDLTIERNRLTWLAGLGVNAVCFDYRGYGFSEGTPAADAIRDDAVRVFDHVKQAVAPAGARVFVYGWSVGSELAIHVAAQRPVAGVMLQAPPASAEAMEAASRRADVPAIVRWAVRLKSDAAVHTIYQGAAEIRAVTAPLLVIEGTTDRTVPPSQARAVFDAAGSRDKQFVSVAGADHNTLAFRNPPASTALARFLDARRP